MFISMFLILVVPIVTASYLPLFGGAIIARFYYVLFIVLITTILNIVRAFRYCKRKPKSYGVNYGWKKGIVAGIGAVSLLTLIQFNPQFETPFLFLSFLPYFDAIKDGLILSVMYALSYMLFGYTIWGGDC